MSTPAQDSLDKGGILLINKANTASAANAHRILTNTTGNSGGMAEAIIPKLAPGGFHQGVFVIKPHQD